MRVAYADPPYIGQARKHYLADPRCAEVDHRALVEKLRGYDGWALSLSSPTLGEVLGYCPPKVRVGAWVKPFVPFNVGVNPAYAWEPVIFSPARKGKKGKKPTSLDWVSSVPVRGPLTGEKPETFSLWLFDILGAEAGDSFYDLFPGTGAVSRAWEHWRRRVPLLWEVRA